MTWQSRSSSPRHLTFLWLWMSIAAFYVFESANGQTCTTIIGQTSKCRCSYKDSSGTFVKTFDFTQLSNHDKGGPAFPLKSVSGQDYQYSYNPCYGFTEKCTDVAACQVSNDGSVFYDIGDPDSPTYSVAANNDIVITYTSEGRSSIVNFHCDKKALNKATYTPYGEGPTSTYTFTVGSCLACVDDVPGCYSGSKLTVGGILCIIFTVLLVVYIVGGILFQKYARGATGKEMVPNYTFWSDFPALVKDGFMFLIGLCKGQDSEYEAIK